ncbi:MAG: DUF1080 domain-containing protein [Acaryochloridaceae cyanobacterium RL_2_7]|nr:DUF1080 domain-containing protein [Acaryochloridaceae cyanobacterium RL_2_7]
MKQWPDEVREHLKARYEDVEKDIGADRSEDLIYGKLYDDLYDLLEQRIPDNNHLKLIPAPIAVSADSPASGLYSPDAYSSLGGLLEAIRLESTINLDLKSIFLVPNTRVYQLETERGRVTRIHVIETQTDGTPEKKSFELSPQCDVILAGTAIESTRLALNSFPRFTNPAETLIGRNLMAHLFSAVTVRIKREALNFKAEEKLQSALFHIQGHSERFKKTFHFQLFCDSDPNFSSQEMLYKMFYDLDQVTETIQRQDKEWVTILALTCSEITGNQHAPVQSSGTNSMHLSSSLKDTFGDINYPRPFIQWESSHGDEQFWDEVHTILLDLMESLAPAEAIEYYLPKEHRWIDQKPTQDQIDQYQRTEAFWDSRHESGTMWMGENADESVTDVDGKLHHVQNVYVADQALFPTVGSANPVLTGLTLDLKIAQAMVDRYQDYSDSLGRAYPNGFQPLFTGSFEGWKIQKTGDYRIIQDEILELQPQGGMGVVWYHLQQFSEFELMVDWRGFDYSMNGGVVIHAADPAKNADDVYRLGYEIQVDESGYDYLSNIHGSPKHKTGAIYNLRSANRGNAKKMPYWNRYKITSRHNQITVELNGKEVSHLDSMLSEKNKSGYICLQFHTGTIQFKNVYLHNLEE